MGFHFFNWEFHLMELKWVSSSDMTAPLGILGAYLTETLKINEHHMGVSIVMGVPKMDVFYKGKSH